MGKPMTTDELAAQARRKEAFRIRTMGELLQQKAIEALLEASDGGDLRKKNVVLKGRLTKANNRIAELEA